MRRGAFMSPQAEETTKKLLNSMTEAINKDSSPVRMICKITELFYLESNRMLRPYNLTPEQSILLVHLYTHDGISQKNLAGYVFKDQANTTRILKRILEKGLVRRISPEHDKRQNLIYLTEHGKQLVEEIVPKIHDVQNDIINTLNNQESQQFTALLFRYYENITAAFAKYIGDKQ